MKNKIYGKLIKIINQNTFVIDKGINQGIKNGYINLYIPVDLGEHGTLDYNIAKLSIEKIENNFTICIFDGRSNQSFFGDLFTREEFLNIKQEDNLDISRQMEIHIGMDFYQDPNDLFDDEFDFA